MTQPATKIVTVDPADLRAHPLTKTLFLLDDEDPRFIAIKQAMLDHGFDADKPVTITESRQILDGRHRVRAAKQCGIAGIPAIVVPDGEAATVIADSIALRKHFGKGAVAFELFPVAQAVVSEAAERSRRNFGTHFGTGPHSVRTGLNQGLTTKAEVLERYGIAETTWRQAEEVHAIFESDPDYAKEMIPKLYGWFVGGEHESNRPIGLGGIIAGHVGKSDDVQGKATRTRAAGTHQLALFTRTYADLANRWEYWTAFRPEEKQAARKALADTLRNAPDDYLDGLKESVAAEIRRRKEEGQ